MSEAAETARGGGDNQPPVLLDWLLAEEVVSCVSDREGELTSGSPSGLCHTWRMMMEVR